MYTSTCGLTPVPRDGSTRMDRRMSGSTYHQVAPVHASRHLRMPFLMVAFIRSTRPFARGFYDAMYLCDMPTSLQYRANWPRYSVPRSVRTIAGMPNRHTMQSCKNSAHAAEVSARNGAASTHFEKGSTATMIHVAPDGCGGSSATIVSNAHMRRGAPAFSVGNKYGCALNWARSFWATVLERATSKQSRCMPCQKYLLRSNWYKRCPSGNANAPLVCYTMLRRSCIGGTTRSV